MPFNLFISSLYIYIYSISLLHFYLMMTFWKRRNVVPCCFIIFYRRFLLSNVLPNLYLFEYLNYCLIFCPASFLHPVTRYIINSISSCKPYKCYMLYFLSSFEHTANRLLKKFSSLANSKKNYLLDYLTCLSLRKLSPISNVESYVYRIAT